MPVTGTEFELPALKHLGELAGTRPIIIICDQREQKPLPFERLKSRPGTLQTGDYSIAGLENLFAIERKSIPDLCACCVGANRQRLERQLHRLRPFHFKRLLIVGRENDLHLGRYHSSITPQAVFATLSAFEIRYDIPIVFCPTATLAGRKIESWGYWFAREYILAANELLRATVDQGVDPITNREEAQRGQS
jgi:DNA excision repair protein ERCC-4